MLQLTDGKIIEQDYSVPTTAGNYTTGNIATLAHYSNGISGGVTNAYWTNPSIIYWQSYPVYVCADKTKKAIDVLKALQSEKLLKCDSVPRFIELVEKISGLL